MPFRDVRGHRRVVGLLARAISRNSLPPSLLFTGPEGVGKRLAAVAVAQAFNCEAPVVSASDQSALERDACGTCAACRRIARGVHGDVLIIEPGDTGTIKIEQVREAIDRAGYRPFEGRRRVVIVDDAEAMVDEAQNALLKTLEEPPPASSFIVISSRPDMLLPTVQSRCPRVRFGRLAVDDIAAILVSAHQYSDSDARAAAALADGSVSRALEQDSEEFERAREAATRVLQELARTSDPRGLVQTMKALAPDRRSGGKLAEEREELAFRLRALASLLRDIGILISRADNRWLAHRDLASGLRSLARTYSADHLVRAFSAVDRALSALDGNASPRVISDWLAFQL